jgi:hypothetical protein
VRAGRRACAGCRVSDSRACLMSHFKSNRVMHSSRAINMLTPSEMLPVLAVGSGTSNPEEMSPLLGSSLYRLQPRVKGSCVPVSRQKIAWSAMPSLDRT